MTWHERSECPNLICFQHGPPWTSMPSCLQNACRFPVRLPFCAGSALWKCGASCRRSFHHTCRSPEPSHHAASAAICQQCATSRCACMPSCPQNEHHVLLSATSAQPHFPKCSECDQMQMSSSDRYRLSAVTAVCYVESQACPTTCSSSAACGNVAASTTAHALAPVH